MCAAWSLGPPVQFGDLILPTFIGPDGTSIYYGDKGGRIVTEERVIGALKQICNERELRVHYGGVGSCEALYRISPRMVDDFCKQGCICMENGEAATLFAVTREAGIIGAALFQPYIDLERGWDPGVLSSELYRTTCHLQAEVVLEAIRRLDTQGRLS